ncbi:MAG: PP2C family protein-serine/threonine phosphatase, partial [Ktedonobacteraceae bacterium]
MEQPKTTLSPFFNQFLIDSANQTRASKSQSEDAVLTDSSTGLLGVFDSVGGRDKGLLVSHLAAKTIASAWQSLSETERQGSLTQLEAALQALIQQADTAIASLVLPPEQRRPATTAALCVLSLQQTQAYVTLTHIGDSRVSLLRAGQHLQRLTQDHGYFPFAVRQGRITKEESVHIEQAGGNSELSLTEQAHFLRRNEITCAVGWTDFPHIPTCSLALLPGDRIVLCT